MRHSNPVTSAAPAVCSSSGGKDSLLALWYARRAGVDVRAMLTMLEETGSRSRSHGIDRALVEQQAAALGLECELASAGWNDYERVFIEALRGLRGRGYETAVFGDIDLEAHREWEERVCREAALEARLPLWHRDRGEIAREVIELGFRAIVVCVDSRHLPDEMCGRDFDTRFISELPPSVDPCGENGEFHTFVVDGPLFVRPVRVRLTGREAYVAPPERGGVRYCFARLAPG